MQSSPPIEPPAAHVPTPRSERGAWAIAIALATVGVGVLVAVLTGAIGRSTAATASPPAVVVVAPTPVPAAVSPAQAAVLASGEAGTRGSRKAIVARPSRAQQREQRARFVDLTEVPIAAAWVQGFYPIYATAQRTFGVNWLLLASIHKQESAFSTAPSTYHGLNFAGCCGGPMQFNVTNGPVSTWQLVRDAYRYGRRPAVYDHRTARHPSIYDDFDAVMAAAWLLSSDGAGYGLERAAWDAAYDYYGHDATGVSYADEVLARAIGWSQHGFCVECGVETAMVRAVHEAYGAPVLGALEAEQQASAARVTRHARRRPSGRSSG